jgi:hypothetical protein
MPGLAGTITGDASICIPASGVIYSVIPIANATGYVWTVPAGATITSGSNTSSITVDFSLAAVSGNITVYGTNSCGNGTASPNFAVTVGPTPQAPVITISNDTLSSNAPSGNQWYMDGTMIPGATGQTYIAVQTGHYTDVITLNGCSSVPSNDIYYVVIGIEETIRGGTISIYPNPSDGLFTMVISTSALQTFNLSVLNNLGLTVFASDDIKVNGTVRKTLDLRSAPNGVYSIMLQNNETHVVKKIIINK